ncbi:MULTISPECIES: site-specific integrase [Acinetobacter]|uniref:site-specific integrase n=1 Tax=Acinetobacter TaxID=469 RepID=UPI00300B372D
MTRVVIAKNPNLSFLTVGKKGAFEDSVPLPIILKNMGQFDWEANEYLTHYAGGARTYNIRPLATSVSKKAYSLNLFCDFLEHSNTELNCINDDTLYRYVERLKERNITDATIISHIRTALGYIVHLNVRYPKWYLATNKINHNTNYKVHYSSHKYIYGRFERSYLSHRCLNGLIHIKTEAEFVRDHEYLMWLDAINSTTFHPEVDDFLIARWQALGTLMEITGSRISEVDQITKKMIQNAATDMLDPSAKHIIRDIKIAKGKYKGKGRNVPVNKEDLQVILIYLNKVEERFPDIKHDGIFVDAKTGQKLKQSYLKNYARKIIDNSPHAQVLRHIVNHSFRHRYITLYIAKAISKLSKQGSFTNILTVAAEACRKLTMHASDKTLAHYVHLACELNESNNFEDKSNESLSSHVRSRIAKLVNISERLESSSLSNSDALSLLLTEIHELKKLNITTFN